MKITFFAHLAPPRHCAGAERMLEAMLGVLVDAGHTVDWLLSRATLEIEPYDLHGITVHPLGSYDIATQLMGCDLVVSHLENMGRAMTWARLAEIPYILVMHNDLKLSMDWAAADAAAIVLNSQWMAEAYGHPTNGLIVRPPVFTEQYRTTPGDKVTLINLNEAKGGQVFADLARRMPDVEFLGVMGAYGDQIVPVLPNVEIRQHGTDMRDVYGSTRILLAPSSYESWGRVGVEAMASGIPVIAHPTPGLLESLDFAGNFVHRGDLDGWEATLRRLLEEPGIWERDSELSRHRSAKLEVLALEDLTRWLLTVEQLGASAAAA